MSEEATTSGATTRNPATPLSTAGLKQHRTQHVRVIARALRLRLCLMLRQMTTTTRSQSCLVLRRLTRAGIATMRKTTRMRKTATPARTTTTARTAMTATTVTPPRPTAAVNGRLLGPSTSTLVFRLLGTYTSVTRASDVINDRMFDVCYGPDRTSWVQSPNEMSPNVDQWT